MAKRVRTTSIEEKQVLQSIEGDVQRARDRIESRQPRFTADASRFFRSVVEWTRKAEELREPRYELDSRKRDGWQIDLYHKEPHLAGVLNSCCVINSNRGYTLTGGRNQVYRYSAILHDNSIVTPTLRGWRLFQLVASEAFYTTNLGALSEVWRDGAEGPLRGQRTLDSTCCWLDPDVDNPLNYQPKVGNDLRVQRWPAADFRRIVSMPTQREEFLGLGWCAVARCLELAKIMVAIYWHTQERLAARIPQGFLTVYGLSQEQFRQALEAKDEARAAREREWFDGVAIIATTGQPDEVSLALTSLSQLPEQFDVKLFTDLLMYGYALAFGYDPSEFWPVQYGALGRGTETEVQHRKATGKGGMEYHAQDRESLQRLLPDTLEFIYDERDDEGELLLAEVSKAWADNAATLAGAKTAGIPLISMPYVASYLAEHGVIPTDWTEIEEEEQIDDTERTLRWRREEALAKPEVRRAIECFPTEPLISYHWPTSRERILWRRAMEAYDRHTFPTAIARQMSNDNDEVLARIEEGTEAVVITEADVTRAVTTGARRVGADFSALLEVGEEEQRSAGLLDSLADRLREIVG